tara:strand:- start:327 stop:731 length:405 start_codon:yes stop_codon:yes gene_type:complete
MKQIKGTKRDLVAILKGLLEVQDLPGKDFGIAVAQNLELLQSKLQDIEKMGTVSSKFLEIANVINQLTKEEKIEEAQKLEHENQHLLDERRDQLSQVEIALDVKASIKLHIIERRILPDTISGKQIYGITRILE